MPVADQGDAVAIILLRLCMSPYSAIWLFAHRLASARTQRIAAHAQHSANVSFHLRGAWSDLRRFLSLPPSGKLGNAGWRNRLIPEGVPHFGTKLQSAPPMDDAICQVQLEVPRGAIPNGWLRPIVVLL